MLFTMRTMDSMKTIKIIHKCLSHLDSSLPRWIVSVDSPATLLALWGGGMMSIVPAYFIKTADSEHVILRSAARHKNSTLTAFNEYNERNHWLISVWWPRHYHNAHHCTSASYRLWSHYVSIASMISIRIEIKTKVNGEHGYKTVNHLYAVNMVNQWKLHSMPNR